MEIIYPYRLKPLNQVYHEVNNGNKEDQESWIKDAKSFIGSHNVLKKLKYASYYYFCTLTTHNLQKWAPSLLL